MLFAESLITGGLAGVVVEAALYPIDTIKTRVQVVSPQTNLCYDPIQALFNYSLISERVPHYDQCLTYNG